MSPRTKDTSSEDIFEDSRMSFGEHIEDLRTHLIRAIFWFVFFVVISFFPFIGKNVLRFIAHPIEKELAVYWEKYYRERTAEVLDKLDSGDEDLASRNRPITMKL